MNATTNGPRITAEHIAAVMDALTFVGASEQRGALTKAGLALMTGLSGRVVEATVEAIHQLETLQGERTLIRRMRDAEAPNPTLWAVAS